MGRCVLLASGLQRAGRWDGGASNRFANFWPPTVDCYAIPRCSLAARASLTFTDARHHASHNLDVRPPVTLVIKLLSHPCNNSTGPSGPSGNSGRGFSGVRFSVYGFRFTMMKLSPAETPLDAAANAAGFVRCWNTNRLFIPNSALRIPHWATPLSMAYAALVATARCSQARIGRSRHPVLRDRRHPCLRACQNGDVHDRRG